VCYSKAVQRDIPDRIVLTTDKLNQPLDNRCLDQGAAQLETVGRHVIQNPLFPVEVPFAGRVQLFEDVLDVELRTAIHVYGAARPFGAYLPAALVEPNVVVFKVNVPDGPLQVAPVGCLEDVNDGFGGFGPSVFCERLGFILYASRRFVILRHIRVFLGEGGLDRPWNTPLRPDVARFARHGVVIVRVPRQVLSLAVDEQLGKLEPTLLYLRQLAHYYSIFVRLPITVKFAAAADCHQLRRVSLVYDWRIGGARVLGTEYERFLLIIGSFADDNLYRLARFCFGLAHSFLGASQCCKRPLLCAGVCVPAIGCDVELGRTGAG